MSDPVQVHGNLVARIKPSSMADLPGKVLYSGVSTLRRGDVYILGLNPGGDPETQSTTVLEDLLEKRSPNRNEYLDGEWVYRRRVCSAGGHPRQKRIQDFLGCAGISPRGAFCSNAIFVRTRRAADLSRLPNYPVIERECGAIHAYLLDVVEPRVILCWGWDCHRLVRRRFGRDRIVCRVPHFSARISHDAFLREADSLREALNGSRPC